LTVENHKLLIWKPH